MAQKTTTETPTEHLNLFVWKNQGSKPVGTQPKYRTPKDLQKEIINYIEDCFKYDKRPDKAGLTLYLGFAANSWATSYKKKSKGFNYIVSRAERFIEHEYVQLATDPKTKNSKGAQFVLSAVYGYSEKVETKHTGTAGQVIYYPSKAPKGAPVQEENISKGKKYTQMIQKKGKEKALAK